ncbi:MAG: tetratricopeptide repeat protein [Poseidonibacter sp.]|uniref:tetratricopeptide repeat protein n=1 Tax=Poseidonibacter sp. TaxID=2321188 RepID=UPI00359CD66A
MIIQKNNFFLKIPKISRIFFLLIFLQTLAFCSFKSIYYFKNPELSYSIENGDYRVYIKEPRYISKDQNGFKFYLPNFTKSYNLEMLRVGSIGYISGYLSKNSRFLAQNIIENINENDLEYYTSNFLKKKKNQLSYLLNNKVIPYERFTSIIIEASNIPSSINTKLNKWIYFSFDKTNTVFNDLVYSYTMILDKKKIDTYISNHFKIIQHSDNKFNKIHTYFMNLDKKDMLKKDEVKKEIKKKVVKEKQKTEKEKKVKKEEKKEKKEKQKAVLPSYSLDIKRINEMIAFNKFNSLNDKAIDFYKEKKYLKSRQLLEEALIQSNESSVSTIYYNLGIIYSKINTVRSNQIAIDYFKSSELKEAYFNLGIYNYIGLGIKEDDKQAYKYFTLSAKKGFKRAQKNVEIMQKYKIGLN